MTNGMLESASPSVISSPSADLMPVCAVPSTT
jgi:hypothetical protein